MLLVIISAAVLMLGTWDREKLCLCPENKELSGNALRYLTSITWPGSEPRPALLSRYDDQYDYPEYTITVPPPEPVPSVLSVGPHHLIQPLMAHDT